MRPSIRSSGKLLTDISSVLLLFIVGILVFTIVSRYVGVNVLWLTQLGQIFTVWTVFLVLTSVALQDEMIEIDYFYRNYFSNFRYMDLFISAVNTLTVLLLVWAISMSVTSSIGRSTSGGMPLALLYIGPFFGFVILGAYYLDDIWRQVKKER